MIFDRFIFGNIAYRCTISVHVIPLFLQWYTINPTATPDSVIFEMGDKQTGQRRQSGLCVNRRGSKRRAFRLDQNVFKLRTRLRQIRGKKVKNQCIFDRIDKRKFQILIALLTMILYQISDIYSTSYDDESKASNR